MRLSRALGTSLLPAALAIAWVGSAQAHEIRPCYLEVRETGAETFDVTWKVPARGDLRLALYVRLPENCMSQPTSVYRTGDAVVERFSTTCAGGLVGREIGVSGLSATLTDALVRLERPDGTAQVERLSASNVAFVVAATPSAFGVAVTYLRLGVEHILLGIDHLLFVLGLLMLVDGRRRLIGTITAFTVAHSLTLAAAALGYVRVPQAPVEAVIALSIAFVAGEILHADAGRPGLTKRAPWIVAFAFGLLHGFGFAGALSAIGLPVQAVPLALLFFNVGVELGQLLFVAGVLAVAAAARRTDLPRPGWALKAAAYAIGAVAAYWTIERVAGFLTA